MEPAAGQTKAGRGRPGPSWRCMSRTCQVAGCEHLSFIFHRRQLHPYIPRYIHTLAGRGAFPGLLEWRMRRPAIPGWMRARKPGSASCRAGTPQPRSDANREGFDGPFLPSRGMMTSFALLHRSPLGSAEVLPVEGKKITLRQSMAPLVVMRILSFSTPWDLVAPIVGGTPWVMT